MEEADVGLQAGAALRTLDHHSCENTNLYSIRLFHGIPYWHVLHLPGRGMNDNTICLTWPRSHVVDCYVRFVLKSTASFAVGVSPETFLLLLLVFRPLVTLLKSYALHLALWKRLSSGDQTLQHLFWSWAVTVVLW
jgi:hypothetical protein